MQLQMTFKKKLNHGVLEDIIQKKSKKIERLLGKNVKVQWLLDVEKDNHFSEVHISGHKGPIIRAHAISDNLLKTIDDVIKKVETQIKKKKGKQHNYRPLEMVANT